MHNFTKLLSYCSLLIASQYLYASQLNTDPTDYNKLTIKQVIIRRNKLEQDIMKIDMKIRKLLKEEHHMIMNNNKSYIGQISQTDRKLLVAGYTRREYADKVFPNTLRFLKKLIQYFLHDNPTQYKEKPLPSDFFGQDLRGFDLTGCDFSFTDMRNTNLKDAILDKTTCNYMKLIRKIQKKGKKRNYNLFTKQLAKLPPAMIDHLLYIHMIYPNQPNNHKAKLIHIGAGLTKLWLSLCENKNDNSNQVSQAERDLEKEYAVKVFRYFFEFWRFKKKLNNDKLNDFGENIKEKLLYLDPIFEIITNFFCRKSNYSGVQWKSSAQGNMNEMMGQYSKLFEEGINKHIGQKYLKEEFYFYNEIGKIIQTLENLCRLKVKNIQVKQKACNIACGLSKSYQFSEGALFSWYLYWLKRLGEFKNKELKEELKKNIALKEELEKDSKLKDEEKKYDKIVNYSPIPYPIKLKKPYAPLRK